MFSNSTASCRALSGDWQANVLQLCACAAFVVAALIKRRCFESPLRRRHQVVWRWDVCRQFMATCAGMTVLLVFARGLQGDDCLNFVGLLVTDVIVGLVVDGLLVWLFAAGGMRLGYYGEPPCPRTFAAQAMACTVISVASRSVSCCIGSLALTGIYESHCCDRVDFNEEDMFLYLTLLVPTAYFILRFTALDVPHKAGYTRIQAQTTTPARNEQRITSPLHVIGEAENDDDDVHVETLPHVDPSGRQVTSVPSKSGAETHARLEAAAPARSAAPPPPSDD